MLRAKEDLQRDHMRHYRALKSVAVCCCAVIASFSHDAAATVQSASDLVLVPYANSSVENPVSFGVSYSTISSVCASIVYIPPEDKQLFATALSAQVSGIHVNIKYDDGAATESFGSTSAWSGTNLHCKLLAIWINKSSY
jgi:hypothetical protein